MSDTEPNDLESRIKASLDASVQQLDADTLQRLNAARRAALNPPSKARWLSAHYWLPAASLAFCTVVGVMLLLPMHASNPSSTLEHTAMLELMENPEELDVISDPGFYLWLDEVGVSESEGMVNNAV
jgi:Protein of unknown function (DUF3619)